MMTKNVIRDCTDNSISIQAKKGINKDVNNKCNQFCDASSLFPYEYNGKCYANCEKGFLHDSNNKKINKCKCELDECLLCPTEALKMGYAQNAILIIIRNIMTLSILVIL